MARKLIDFTSTALIKLNELMDAKDVRPLGLRVSLKTKGCSGLSWNLDFIDAENKFDEKVDFGNFKVFIDTKAVLFVLGSNIDYIKTDLEEGFQFVNPNEKGKCGCGESFTV
jgi:iron-sulfur cluster assembly protein